MILLDSAELRCGNRAAVSPAPHGVKRMGSPMSQNQRDYEVGRGKPPVHSRFKKSQSGNPRGPRPKHLSALLVETLDEPVVVTIDGERGEITKREAVVTWLVNNRPVRIRTRPRC
jgi:hypothetical protein